MLSDRAEPYWQAQRDPATIPPSLAEQLALWREQPPSGWDFPEVNEIFPAASQHYVLYGMGFAPPPPRAGVPSEQAARSLAEVREAARRLGAALPSNRTYLDALRAMLASNANQQELLSR